MNKVEQEKVTSLCYSIGAILEVVLDEGKMGVWGLSSEKQTNFHYLPFPLPPEEFEHLELY